MQKCFNYTRKKLKEKGQTKGITLVALVITIILLLILAGVAISMAVDSDGLFAKAREATEKWNTTVANEETQLNELMDLLKEKKAVFIDGLANKTHSFGTYQEITKFERATQEPAEGNKNVVSTTESDYPIYMWSENNVLYWYSKANKVELSANSGQLFSGFSKLEDASGVSSWDTSNVTDMNYMFGGCYKLTSVNVSNWNTSNVTDMNNMFGGCSELTSVNVSNWDTSNVTNMYGMFSGCYELTSIDLSNWDTSNVTNMSYMFRRDNTSGYTSKLQRIIVSSKFKVDAVTESTNMFEGCTALVGGQGTTYNASNIDVGYAHIDGGTSNPGYFTSAQ
jgi:surface protein